MLERLFSALKTTTPSRVSSNIEKVVETLLLSKRSKFLEWLNGCKKCLALFIKHIDVKSISEIFRKILHFADGGDINSSGDGPGLNLWSGVDHKSQDEGSKSPSNEHPIVESLIARLVQKKSDSTTYLNILATITDMIERSTGDNIYDDAAWGGAQEYSYSIDDGFGHVRTSTHFTPGLHRRME